MNLLKNIISNILYLLAGLSIVFGALVSLIGLEIGIEHIGTAIFAPHFLHIVGQVLMWMLWIVIGIAFLGLCYGLGLNVCGKLDDK